VIGMPRRKSSKKKLPLPKYKLLVVSQGSQLKKIGAKAFMDFINPFVDEKAYLSVQKKVTLRQEREWLAKKAEEIDKGEQLEVLLLVGGKIAGNCDARRGVLSNQKHNVTFGLAVSRQWRGFGFGELLLRKGI